MKRFLMVFFMTLMYACVAGADAGIFGPMGASSGYSDWVENANGIPIAYFAAGDDCPYRLDSLVPEQMCATTRIVGQAFCTTHYWVDGDLDITKAAPSGRVCWCRRTHVAVNGNLVEDIGPWTGGSSRVSEANCREYCARMCASSLTTNFCSDGLDARMFLPAY